MNAQRLAELLVLVGILAAFVFVPLAAYREPPSSSPLPAASVIDRPSGQVVPIDLDRGVTLIDRSPAGGSSYTILHMRHAPRSDLRHAQGIVEQTVNVLPEILAAWRAQGEDTAGLHIVLVKNPPPPDRTAWHIFISPKQTQALAAAPQAEWPRLLRKARIVEQLFSLNSHPQ
jgi:hypothetical protein